MKKQTTTPKVKEDNNPFTEGTGSSGRAFSINPSSRAVGATPDQSVKTTHFSDDPEEYKKRRGK